MVAEDQTPLLHEPVEDPDDFELILADAEVWLDKLYTDVVVCGHAWNHPGGPHWLCEVAVGRFPPKQVLAQGDRSCSIDHAGRLVFSPPGRADKIPLSYRYAYGGCDERAEREGSFEFAVAADRIPDEDRERALASASPWRYPRNRGGRGYLVEKDPESIETLSLPNLEDPRDLLTPERLIVNDPWHWPLQPLPASLDWLEHGAFPRLGWFGETPDWDVEEIGNRMSTFPELRFGYADQRLFETGVPLREKFDRQALNGASLGLRFRYLRGDEQIHLTNLHPKHARWTVQLPPERPRLAVDDRSGGLTELTPYVSIVQLEPDASRLSLVWAGHAEAKRPYTEEELQRMPFLAEW